MARAPIIDAVCAVLAALAAERASVDSMVGAAGGGGSTFKWCVFQMMQEMIKKNDYRYWGKPVPRSDILEKSQE